jgi:hypothetical protein
MSNYKINNDDSCPFKDDNKQSSKYNIDNFYMFDSNNNENFGNILKYNQVSDKTETFRSVKDDESTESFDFSDVDDNDSGYSELFSTSDEYDDDDDDDESEDDDDESEDDESEDDDDESDDDEEDLNNYYEEPAIENELDDEHNYEESDHGDDNDEELYESELESELESESDESESDESEEDKFEEQDEDEEEDEDEDDEDEEEDDDDYEGDIDQYKDDSTIDENSDLMEGFKKMRHSINKHTKKIPPNTKKVYVLGPFGIRPWGKRAKFDKHAQWIWNTPNAAKNAYNTPVKFQYVYKNTTGSPLKATINLIVDNHCKIFINNKQQGSEVGGGWGYHYPKKNVILANGDNLIEFDARNAGGPAGLIVSCVDTNNKVLFRSNKNWYYEKPQKHTKKISHVMQAIPKTIGDFQYSGCYKDTTHRAIPNMIGNVGKGNIDKCISLAEKKGYNVASLQNGQQCFGGENADFNKYGLQTDNNKCNISNPGALTNMVYRKEQPPVSFTVSPNANQVNVLGPFGIKPWGKRAKFDKHAQWIWNTPNAAKNAYNIPVKFQYIFKNTTGFPLKVTINLIVDNYCTIFVNDIQQGSEIGGGWGNHYLKKNVILANGTNLIEFVAKNTGGPAGLIVSCVDANTNTVLFRSNKNWHYEKPPKRINFKYSANTKPVFVLGKFGMPPWGKNANFISKNAQWIWDVKNANKSAPKNNNVGISYVYNNKTNENIITTLHLIIDNQCTFKLNGVTQSGKYVGGWGNNNYPKISVVIKPGRNRFFFKCNNYNKGPGGLLVACVQNTTKKILFQSDHTWKYFDKKEAQIKHRENMIKRKQMMQKKQMKHTKHKNKILPSEANPKLKSLSALDLTAGGETLNLKSVKGIGRQLKLKNQDDVSNLMVNGVFKLRVNLPKMPPYVKGQQFDVDAGVDPNYFYLCVENLDSNCDVKGMNGKCTKVYADNKKCDIKSLTDKTLNNKYRLVLISSQYVLDPSVPLGKNSDFTLIKIGEKTYLKNVQTGYLPTLFMNDSTTNIHGDMEINDNSNANVIEQNMKNVSCGETEPELQTKGSVHVRCNMNTDSSMYLMTTKNLGNSSPISIHVNKDGNVSLKLLRYNNYGFPVNVYSLIFCNFNINTYNHIEKSTNSLGTFLINMVCFDDHRGGSLAKTNNMHFTVELQSFPQEFLKKTSIYNINN